MTKFVTTRKQLLLTISALIFACSFSANSHALAVQASDLSALLRPITSGHNIQLTVAGRDYSIKLWPSDTTSKINGLEASHYKGKVIGDDESWVRLSYLDEQLTGYMKAYGELFEIDTLGSTASAKQIARKIDSTDLEMPTYGVDKVLQPPPLSQSQAIAPPLPSNRQTTDKGVSRIMRLGIVIDSRFDAHYRGRGLEKAISTINAVDGLYQEQFGLAIQLTSATLLDENNDPFISYNGNIEQLLRVFRNYSLDNKNLSTDQTAMHLFSGSSDSNNVIGLSWIDTACRSDGYNASVSIVFSEQMLLAAHELAHNLGAVHDNTGMCDVEYNKVMWPSISASTTNHFSDCSKETIIPKLNASCNLDNVDLGISLDLRQSSSAEDRANILAITVHNTHNTAAATNISTETLLEEPMTTNALPEQCLRLANTVYCDHGDIDALSQRTIEFEISSQRTDTQIVTSEIDAPNTHDVSSNNNSAYIDINNPSTGSGNGNGNNTPSTSAIDDPDTQASAGGGGGATAPLFALALLSITSLKRRRCKHNKSSTS